MSEALRYVLTAYVADEQQFVNRPMIMHRFPMIGTGAGFISIVIFIIIPVNGWLIGDWTGAILLTLFWLLISNPIVRTITAYRSTRLSLYISNPFFQVVISLLCLIGFTIVNAFYSDY